jgi:hypothetical protein
MTGMKKRSRMHSAELKSLKLQEIMEFGKMGKMKDGR